MMGHWQKQTELWVEPVNLGRRIPQDHLLRKINKVLDLGFVRGEVAPGPLVWCIRYVGGGGLALRRFSGVV